MYVDIDNRGVIKEVRNIFPTIDELDKVWNKLDIIEKQSIHEAQISFGIGAHTASEIMALRTLEGVLRRVYDTKEMFGALLKRMEKDPDLKDLKEIFSYFKNVRNKITHPEKLSSQLEAESTFSMMKRLILEVFTKKSI